MSLRPGLFVLYVCGKRSLNELSRQLYCFPWNTYFIGWNRESRLDSDSHYRAMIRIAQAIFIRSYAYLHGVFLASTQISMQIFEYFKRTIEFWKLDKWLVQCHLLWISTVYDVIIFHRRAPHPFFWSIDKIKWQTNCDAASIHSMACKLFMLRACDCHQSSCQCLAKILYTFFRMRLELCRID